MPLPENNLPTASLPWAREVEKQLEAVKDNVAINNINNSARDATSQTSINNLLDLMSDQIELRTYAVEYAFAQGTKLSFVGSTGLPTPTYIDTSKLSIEINLNKPRNLLINFSSYYSAQTLFPGTSTKYSWDIGVEIYVDDIMVDYQSTGKSNDFGPAMSGYINESGSMNMVKIVSVPAGYHRIYVKEAFSTSSSSGATDITTTGDSLIVTVTQ
jgi:hypothetical protein